MANYQIGDIIVFSYEAQTNKVGRVGRHDRTPEVLVLHPSWRRPQESGVPLLHGLNFNYLSDDEKNVVRMIFDPMFEMKFRDALKNRNPNVYSELEKILSGEQEGAGRAVRQTGPDGRRPGVASSSTSISAINSPEDFYHKLIRPFIYTRGWDPYRRYIPGRMKGVRILTPARVVTGEESIAKFRKEREEMAARAKKALGEAKSPADQKIAKEALDKIKKETGMSQRKSLLTFFSERLKYWRGPKFRL